MEPHTIEDNKRKKENTVAFGGGGGGEEEEASRKRLKYQDSRLYECIRTGVLFDFYDQPTTTKEAAREVVKCLGPRNIESIEVVPYLGNEQDGPVNYDKRKSSFCLLVKIPLPSIRLQAQDCGVRANKYPGSPLVYGIPIAAFPEILHQKKAGKHLSFDEIKRRKAW